MSGSKVRAVIEGGVLDGRYLQIRFGDSQKDGEWMIIEVEIEGRLVPFELATKVMNHPPLSE